MENNINKKAMLAYSKKFSTQVSDNFFKDKDLITGKDILNLLEIKQINLFVVKNLFLAWQSESKNLESPFFDYNHADVKKAMNELMNVLSRNISIKKADFTPLLERASIETLLLICSPYDFYTHEIVGDDDEIEIIELKDLSKYVKINANILKNLITQMEKQNLNKVNKEKLNHLLNEVFENTNAIPEDIDQYVQLFSKVLLLTEADIYGDDAVVLKPKAESDQDMTIEKNEGRTDKPVKPLVENLQKTHTVLNDQLIEESKPNLADIHRKKRIDSIARHISINQRFMFINSLFKGDENEFKSTIDTLDNCESKDTALHFLNTNYPNWDHESEEVEEFMELIEKKLA